MKIPRSDPRARYIATATRVGLAGAIDFARDRHRWVLATTRADGRPQMSPVTGGVTPAGRLAIATYPQRAKVANARRNPQVSVLVVGDDGDDPWVQVDGTATVRHMPEAAEDFVDYYRAISGEHPDWDDYRRAMAEQGKCILLIEPTRCGPISTGGFPPSLFED
jgi:PPOX class probable F420-dependent enzyme